MKIAYITLHWPRTRQSGVGQKILTQITIWKQFGHEAKLFMHLFQNVPEEELVPAEYFYYSQRKGIVGRLFTEASRIQALKNLLSRVEQYTPDLIYLRWGMYVFPMQRLRNIAPVVVEINTNDLFEHRRLGLLLYIYNRLTRGITLVNSAGLVCVTRELANANEFVKFQKPMIVISNGINISKIKPFPPPCNVHPRMVFIGTPNMPWHGVEKLIVFANKFPDIIIDIIGYNKIPDIEMTPNNIKLHGYLHGERYREIMAQCDLSIGTLSLYKNGKNENSPLKTLDYLAYGLPVILPYKDTDLDELNCEELLKIPNTPDNILTHGQAIHDFAYRMRGRRIPRELIAPLINSEEKEKQRLHFFQEIIEGKYSN